MEYALGAVADFKLFGFATGSYSCKCNCGVEFIGDKRSSMCLGCAIKKAEFLSDEPPTIHNSDYTTCPECGGAASILDLVGGCETCNNTGHIA
jgi:hypothetical protein